MEFLKQFWKNGSTCIVNISLPNMTWFPSLVALRHLQSVYIYLVNVDHVTDSSAQYYSQPSARIMAQKGFKQAGKKTSQKGKQNASTSESHCAICLDIIIEADESNDGRDAIYCEGMCQDWLHRGCAGLSKKSFNIIKDLIEPYYCPHCLLSDRKSNCKPERCCPIPEIRTYCFNNSPFWTFILCQE